MHYLTEPATPLSVEPSASNDKKRYIATPMELSLICFPHAGGGSGRFRQWHRCLPPCVHLVLPVLPGRENRFGDKPLASIEEITRDAMAQIEEANVDRVALVGLSFGALAAYELAAHLEASGRSVEALFVASQRAPATPAPTVKWHCMDNGTLAAKLVALGGMAREDAEDEEFLSVFLDVIRADLRVSETYLRPTTRDPLNCPIYFYRGNNDSAISVDDGAAWQSESATVRMRILDAGHFLMAGTSDLWLESLTSDLSRHLIQ